MPRFAHRPVVVITGASSGIGRATAHAFAETGAEIVVAARREPALRDVVEECRSRGAQAIAVPTDISNPDAVIDLARRTVDAFGRIDVWVNNAAVSHFARFEHAAIEEWRQVIETNLFGTIYGAREALGRFRRQGHGLLVNVASVVSYVGQPYTSAYVASKFAIRGFSECLRQELLDDPDIHVCTVLPASIDTPIFQHAANRTGRAIKPIPPVYDARLVAETIVSLLERPRPEVFAGRAGRMVALLKRIAPRSTERRVGRKVDQSHFQESSAPSSSGNLFTPMPEWARVSGGWRRKPERARLGPLAAGLALAALPAAALGLTWANAVRRR